MGSYSTTRIFTDLFAFLPAYPHLAIALWRGIPPHVADHQNAYTHCCICFLLLQFIPIGCFLMPHALLTFSCGPPLPLVSGCVCLCFIYSVCPVVASPVYGDDAADKNSPDGP